MIVAAAASDAGPVRPINEDAWAIEPELGLYVVADGMGGHNAGEVASRLAIEALVGFIRRSREDPDISWPYGLDPTMSYRANRLKTAVFLANRRVFRAAESHDDYTGMGTTVAAILVENDHVAVAHAGDSRVYRLSGGELTQVTVDDSWATALASQGALPPELARHPMRHVLTNVVGARDQVDVHLTDLPLGEGDRLLLCSDGLHEPLDAETLRRLLGTGTPTAAADALVRQALARGGRDNVTALVIAREAA